MTLDERISALVADGLHDPAIADRLGVSRQTVYRRRRALGLAAVGRLDLDDRLRQMIAVDGLTLRAAARLLGVDPSWVSRRVRRLGLRAPASADPAPVITAPLPVVVPPNRAPLPRGSDISWSALVAASSWRPS